MEEKNQNPGQELTPDQRPAEMPPLDPEFTRLPDEVISAEPVPETVMMDSFFTTPEPLEPVVDQEAEAVDVPEDVEVPEIVEIPEIVEAPEIVQIVPDPTPEAIPAAEPAPIAPDTSLLGPAYEESYIPQELLREEDTSLLGPGYEESFITQEMLREAGIDPDATTVFVPVGQPDDMDATQIYPTAQLPAEEFYSAPEAPPVDQAFLAADEDPQEFEELFHGTGEAAPRANREPRQPRKGRPQKEKGEGLLGLSHLASTVIWLAIIVAIGVTLGKALWVCAADVLAFGRENQVVTVTIVEGDTIDTITTKLKDAGLIQYPGLFKVYAQLTNAQEEISTGTFQLNTNYDYHALVNGLSPSSSGRTVVEVVIPEGYNCRQIFALLEAENVCSAASLEAYAATGEFKDFWFLADVQRGDKYCLEGFLFPDTYEFYVNSTPREALGKMLLGFETRFTQEMRDQLPALNERLSAKMRENGCSEEFIAQNQLGIRELVIVASMIEEESAAASESPNIASVIYNRLTQDQIHERYLGIDATIIYVTGDPNNIDTTLDSPYNTRTHAGLTPTPISNPGLSSLEAALDPADTKYYYYVLNPDTEMHQFSKTYEEHEKLVEKFREAAKSE